MDAGAGWFAVMYKSLVCYHRSSASIVIAANNNNTKVRQLMTYLLTSLLIVHSFIHTYIHVHLHTVLTPATHMPIDSPEREESSQLYNNTVSRRQTTLDEEIIVCKLTDGSLVQLTVEFSILLLKNDAISIIIFVLWAATKTHSMWRCRNAAIWKPLTLTGYCS